MTFTPWRYPLFWYFVHDILELRHIVVLDSLHSFICTLISLNRNFLWHTRLKLDIGIALEDTKTHNRICKVVCSYIVSKYKTHIQPNSLSNSESVVNGDKVDSKSLPGVESNLVDNHRSQNLISGDQGIRNAEGRITVFSWGWEMSIAS